MNAALQTLGRREHEHGDQCGCRLLAAAVGVESSAVDFNYCRYIIQKRWGVRCNHGGGVFVAYATPELPPHDSYDAVQVILIANAI